jgi:drug/metabolite transporter (DMT)-like permease
MLFVMFQCLQQFFGKLIYDKHAHIHSPEYLFARSLFSFAFFVILMNYRVFHYMWFGIPRHEVKMVVMKSALGIAYMSCLYSAIKYLPLIVASLIQNLTPILTAIFSHFMLKRGLTPFKILILILSFGGIVVMLTAKMEASVLVFFDPDPDLGGDDTFDLEDMQVITVSMVLPISLMLCVPVLNSIITVLFAKMKGLSEFTVCSYQDLGLIILLGPGLLIFSRTGVSFFRFFDWVDYLYISAAGISSAFVQIFRMKAVQHHDPARLAVLNYFQNVF